MMGHTARNMETLTLWFVSFIFKIQNMYHKEIKTSFQRPCSYLILADMTDRYNEKYKCLKVLE